MGILGVVFTFWSRSDCESVHEFVITTKRKLSANDQESVQVEHQVEHQATNQVANQVTKTKLKHRYLN